MKSNYNFSKAIKNPYAKRMKKPVTIRLNADAIRYFKEMSKEMGVPYQSLIDLYLRDCAAKRRKLKMSWRRSA